MNSWDKYFLEICNVVASNSKCLSRKIGAILVKDKRILCTGYNGAPSGVPHCNHRYLLDKALIKEMKEKGIEHDPDLANVCPRRALGYKSGEGLHLCIAGHAERNCLITAARVGIATEGCSLYMNVGIPCKDCLIEIINAGIKEIVVTSLSYYDAESEYLVEQSNLKIREYAEDERTERYNA